MLDRERTAIARVLGATYLQAVGVVLAQTVFLVAWVAITTVAVTALVFADSIGPGFRTGLIAAGASAAVMSSIGVLARYLVARELLSRRIRQGPE